MSQDLKIIKVIRMQNLPDKPAVQNLPALKKGESLMARVVLTQGDNITLKTDEGRFISAKLLSGMALKGGENVELIVKDSTLQQITLQLLSIESAASSFRDAILQAANLQNNPSAKIAWALFRQLGTKPTQKDIETVLDILKENPSLDEKTAVFFAANKIPATKENVRLFLSIAANQDDIGKGLSGIMQELIGELETGMAAGRTGRMSDRAMQRLLTALVPEAEKEAGSGIVRILDRVKPNQTFILKDGEGAYRLANWPEFTEEPAAAADAQQTEAQKSPSDAQQADARKSTPDMQRTGERQQTANTQQTGENRMPTGIAEKLPAAEPEDAGQSKPAGMPRGETGLPDTPSLPETPAQSEAPRAKDAPPPDDKAAAGAKGTFSSPRDVLSRENMKFSDMDIVFKIFTLFANPDEELGFGKTASRTLKELDTLQEMLKYSDIKNREDYSGRIDNLITQERAASDVSRFVCMHIPVIINKDVQTAELYIYKKKRGKKIDAENTVIQLGIDTLHAGRVETRIQIEKKNVSMLFRLENEDAGCMVKDRTPRLFQQLNELGYRLKDVKVQQLTQRTTILDAEEELIGAGTPVTIDCRV